jgi:hypothetical protein
MIEAVLPTPGADSERNVPTTLGSEPAFFNFSLPPVYGRMKAGIRNHANGFGREPLDRSENLVREFSGAGIHDEWPSSPVCTTTLAPSPTSK